MPLQDFLFIFQQLKKNSIQGELSLFDRKMQYNEKMISSWKMYMVVNKLKKNSAIIGHQSQWNN